MPKIVVKKPMCIHGGSVSIGTHVADITLKEMEVKGSTPLMPTSRMVADGLANGTFMEEPVKPAAKKPTVRNYEDE